MEAIFVKDGEEKKINFATIKDVITFFAKHKKENIKCIKNNNKLFLIYQPEKSLDKKFVK